MKLDELSGQSTALLILALPSTICIIVPTDPGAWASQMIKAAPSDSSIGAVELGVALNIAVSKSITAPAFCAHLNYRRLTDGLLSHLMTPRGKAEVDFRQCLG